MHESRGRRARGRRAGGAHARAWMAPVVDPSTVRRDGGELNSKKQVRADVGDDNLSWLEVLATTPATDFFLC